MATAPQNRFADSKAFRDPEVVASQRQATDAPLWEVASMQVRPIARSLEVEGAVLCATTARLS